MSQYSDEVMEGSAEFAKNASLEESGDWHKVAPAVGARTAGEYNGAGYL